MGAPPQARADDVRQRELLVAVDNEALVEPAVRSAGKDQRVLDRAVLDAQGSGPAVIDRHRIRITGGIQENLDTTQGTFDFRFGDDRNFRQSSLPLCPSGAG